MGVNRAIERCSDAYAAELGLRWHDPRTLCLTVGPHLINGVGLLLGPVVFSLVDYCMTSAMWDEVDQDHERIATINIGLNFVDSTTGGEVICRSTVDRRTRRIGALTSSVLADDDRLLASAIGTFAISPLPPADRPPGNRAVTLSTKRLNPRRGRLA